VRDVARGDDGFDRALVVHDDFDSFRSKSIDPRAPPPAVQDLEELEHALEHRHE
jgi:hypothetical protein